MKNADVARRHSAARVLLWELHWLICLLTCLLSLSGWISSLTGLNKNIPVGIMMIIIAALFTASAVISLVMFKKVSGSQRLALPRWPWGGVPPALLLETRATLAHLWTCMVVFEDYDSWLFIDTLKNCIIFHDWHNKENIPDLRIQNPKCSTIRTLFVHGLGAGRGQAYLTSQERLGS